MALQDIFCATGSFAWTSFCATWSSLLKSYRWLKSMEILPRPLRQWMHYAFPRHCNSPRDPGGDPYECFSLAGFWDIFISIPLSSEVPSLMFRVQRTVKAWPSSKQILAEGWGISQDDIVSHGICGILMKFLISVYIQSEGLNLLENAKQLAACHSMRR